MDTKRTPRTKRIRYNKWIKACADMSLAYSSGLRRKDKQHSMELSNAFNEGMRCALLWLINNDHIREPL